MINLLKNIGSVAALMVANVIMGLTIAKIKDEFSKEKLIAGLIKYGSTLFSVALMYGAFLLNGEVQVIEIGGTQLNLLDAMNLVFIAGIAYYGYQDISKLIAILKLKIEGKEVKEQPIKELP